MTSEFDFEISDERKVRNPRAVRPWRPNRLLNQCLLGICGLLISAPFGTCLATADEVVVGIHDRQPQSVGDFDFTSGAGFSAEMFPMPTAKSQQSDAQHCLDLSAGELWSFFESQGINSVDRIVLYMDIGKLDQQSKFTLEAMEFRIEGADRGTLITDSSLDRGEDNRLVIPGYETVGSMPAARMEIKLDYDFMKKFSRDSQERIVVDVDYATDGNVRPMFFIEGRRSLFSTSNIFLLTAFVIFWAVVFWVLKRLTLSKNPYPQHH